MTISISNIRIFPSVPKNGIVAYASAIINEGMYVGSIAIHEKKTNQAFGSHILQERWFEEIGMYTIRSRSNVQK